MSEADLYLVPTPIGNLEDITFRAIRVLNEVDLILAEDTRTSRILLDRYHIQRPMKSFHSFNEHSQVEKLIACLKDGEKMALISDAGTPSISDPGFLLVRACLQQGIKVCCLPGPTALIPALVQSGFPTDRFVFEGFLPHRKGRKTILERLAREDRTVILYESPHRLMKTLEQMVTFMGPNRLISVSRELSKMYEEVSVTTLAEAVEHWGKKPIRGEIVLVIKGCEKGEG